jgi:hypothetical protein
VNIRRKPASAKPIAVKQKPSYPLHGMINLRPIFPRPLDTLKLYA